MRRQFVLSVAWLGMTGLSCSVQIAPHSPPPRGAAAPALAQVAAPAPIPEPAREIRPSAPPPLEPAMVATAAYLASKRTGLVQHEIEALARTIIEESRRNELDPRLVLALMHVESRYYNFAVSKVGALGLMQILPSTGRELAQRAGIPWRGPQTLFDPVVNARLGIAYIRQLADRYDHIPTALAAYNWGPGHIDGRLRHGRPLPQQYPGLVLQAYAATAPAARS